MTVLPGSEKPVEDSGSLLDQLAKLPKVEGVAPVDVLDMPTHLVRALQATIRHGALTLEQLAVELGLDEAQACRAVDVLVIKGYLEPQQQDATSEVRYRAHLMRVRGHNLGIDL